MRGLLGSGWEAIVWGNVRAGSVRLTGTPRAFRLLMRLALWLTIGLLAALLAADVWRRVSPLLPLLFYSDSLAGLFAPVVFVPVMFGLLALAWAYLLAGALHAPGWIKLAVLALFSIFDLGLLFNLFAGLVTELGLVFSGLETSFWAGLGLLVHLIAWLGLLALFAFRWRRAPRLGFEFPVLLGLLGVMLFAAYFGGQLSSRPFQSEAASTALQLTQTVQILSLFLTPFLLIAGAEAAEFGLTLTEQMTARLNRWTRLRRGAGRLLLPGALAVFLVVRLVGQWLAPIVSGEGPPFRWGAAAAVAGFGLGYVWLAWGRRRAWRAARAAALRDPQGDTVTPEGRGASSENLPMWVVPATAMVLYASLLVVQLLSFVELAVAIVFVAVGQSGETILASIERVYDLLVGWNEYFVAALAIAAAGAGWLRARMRRRPTPTAMIYLGIFGAWLLVWISTRPGAWLEGLNFDYGQLSALATPVLLGGMALAAVRRQLAGRTLLHLTGAAVALWLLEFQGWLSDPLSPLPALLGAEAAFLSASIFLNVMAAGNRFGLNRDAGGFPSTSRALLYFGFALLTVANLNWMAATHDIGAIAANDTLAQNGFIAIGLPIVFWAILTANGQLLGERE